MTTQKFNSKPFFMNQRPAARYVPAAALLVTGLSCQSVASAAELVLEEIIVTAQIREEKLQDVPVSISAVSGDKLKSAGIDKIEDLQSYVPNLTMSETAIGTNIYIRGIGSGINQGFEQSTGLYVDGVSYSRAQLSRAPFLDLARVEVLRGPQNILFGKNSIAGAVSMTTNRPGDTFEGSVSALYEPEHGEEVYDVVLSGPITPGLGARLAYRNRSIDGYIENITLDRDEPERDEETVRLIVDWTGTEGLDVTLKYETGKFDVTGRQMEITNESPAAGGPFVGSTYSEILQTLQLLTFGSSDPTLNNTSQDFKRTSNGDSSDNDTQNFTATVNYMLGDHTLTAIAAYMDYDYEEDCDCDFTGANLFRLVTEEDYEQTSLELRLVSPTGGDIEYIAGFYYQDSELNFQDEFFVPDNDILETAVNLLAAPGGTLIGGTSAPREFSQDSDMMSLFLQATWNIRNDLRLTVGGRYSDEEKDAERTMTVLDASGNPAGVGTLLTYANLFLFEPHTIDDSRSEDSFAPLVSVEWDLDEENMLYATATKGSKSGGFDVRSNADPRTPFPAGTFEFEDEKATSLEVGSKSILAGGAAELNVAVFYTEYEDLQVSIYDGAVGFNVGNAAEAETYGVELDGRWLLTESLTLTGSLAYIDFEFTDFKDGQCYSGEPNPNPNGLCSRDGATNQYVADWTGNLGLDHVFPLGDNFKLHSNLDLIYSDDYNPSQTLDPRLDQDSYVKVNARIALADIDNVWEVALVGKNLTDKEIMTYGAPTPLAYSSFGAPSYYTFWERERSVALQGTYRF